MGKHKGRFQKAKKPEAKEKETEGCHGITDDLATKPKTEVKLEAVAEDTVYKFDFDLDELISSSIKDLCNPDRDDDTLRFKQTLNNFSTQLKTVETKQKQVTKILDDCSDKLQQYFEELQDLDKEEEIKEAEAEEAAKDAAEANAKNEETDSDDDVQFISTYFDPDIVAKNKSVVEQNSSLVKTLNSPGAGQTIQTPTSGSRTIILKVPANQPNTLQTSTASTQATSEPPKTKLENLRAVLAATLNKPLQGFTPLSSLVSKQQSTPPSTVSSETVRVLPPGKSDTARPMHHKYGNLTLQQTAEAYELDVKSLSVHSKVYGKKVNEVWYRGSIESIQNGSMNVSDRRYVIKFDGKGKRSLTAREIAFRAHINISVAVGTRIIALYRDEESTASLYAGIIAETPNGRNQYRYLVFFDDGYAQYSTREEIHKVVDQSINVWEDVHQDSQEFIKEYLKQYPERPMVRLHKNQLVKTEWNGKWWTAKVKEVDASLVKMFFLADKREELIYRGSTRLEPLYSALANQEQHKMTGKVKRHNLDSSKQKPVVEYTRGVSNDDNKSEVTRLLRTTDQSEANTIPRPTSHEEAARLQRTTSNEETMRIQRTSSHEETIRLQRTSSPEESARLQRTSSQEEPKKRAVARKTTTHSNTRSLSEDNSWQAPWLKQEKKLLDPKLESGVNRPKDYIASSISSNKSGKDMASLLQERLSKTADTADIVEEESLGERIESLVPLRHRQRAQMKPHSCCPTCLKDVEEDTVKYRGTNPLLIPLLCSWERHVCKIKPGGRRMVAYRAPCGRRLRNIYELDKYLMLTNCSLTVDFFCYEPILHVHTEFVPVKTFCDIKDLSYGKESVPIQCVNGIDRLYPDYVEYSNVRLPAKGVNLNLDAEFMVCCDCTDNCRDKSKCACHQLTVEASACSSSGKSNPNVGFEYRRLKEPLITGVYECNSNCHCDKRCLNRVVQNGLQARLQVFKTEKKGWGLRCLDDLAKGNFICIYAGQLLTEQGANEDGQQFGDEYLAELDYIEVVERQKEGYESDADMDEGLGEGSEDEDVDDSEDEDGANLSHNDSDSDFSGEEYKGSGLSDGTSRTTRRSTRSKNDSSGKQLGKIVLKRDSSKPGVKEEEWTVKSGPVKQPSDDSPIMIYDDDDEPDTKSSSQSSIKKSTSAGSIGDSDSLPDLDADPVVEEPEKEIVKERKPRLRSRSQERSKKLPVENMPAPMEVVEPVYEGVNKRFARRSTTQSKSSRFKNLPDPKKKMGMVVTEDVSKEEEEEEDDLSSTRAFFQDGQDCYIMDAKSCGNIGRYLNHSCTPNVFVQNVFVDTHDLRFPWVTFWAGQYIRAGTELTWDYNYEVGSVPGKVLYCYCGSSDCRGRLL